MMKIRYLLLFLAIFAAQSTFAAEPRLAKSDITEVTVFLRGAQVSREAKVSIRKGENLIRFAGLASGIDPRSIQAAAPPVVLINSVSHEINYLGEQAKSQRVIQLQDSLKLIQEATTQINKENTVLDLEKKMLLKNQSIAGNETGLSITELERAADFFRQRLTDINQRILKNQQAKKKLTKKNTQLNRQLQEWNQRNDQPSNDILVKLNSEYDRTITLRIRYIVQEAGWVPRYDLRAKDTQGPIQLGYNADVYQNTGIDWNKIRLTLSSGDPNQGGTKPELAQWNLYTGVQTRYTGYTRPGEGRAKAEQKYEGERDEDRRTKSDFLQSRTLADYTTVTQGAVTAEFAISIPQDIPSNGKMEQVAIQNSELPAIYQHYAVPKVDKDAFLVARVTDWEALNLLPGAVNIFFEGTYVTEAYLNTANTNDTLDFSLGRDKKVVIQREILKDHNRRRFIGSNRERTFGYEIKVRNTKSTPIRLQLLDQIPVSQDERISVKVEEISGADHNESTGQVTWKLDVQPSEAKTLPFIFSVKHPKKSTVPGI